MARRASFSKSKTCEFPMKDATKSDWQRAFMDQLTGAWPGPPAYDSAFSGKELFHYTTVDGLKGIIEENCIWATAASYLNDATEIEYGCALLDGVFQDWQDANEKKIEALGLQVLSELRNTFKDPLSKSAMTTGIYVTCFCERDNLLSQWRAYGQKGGYSVGFSLLETGGKPSLSLLSPENPHFDMKLVPGTHERAKQSERLHLILTDMLPIIGSSNIRSEAEGEGEKGLATMSRIAFVIIEYFLLDEIVAFKNEAFAEEQEWGIVVRPQITLSKKATWPKND